VTNEQPSMVGNYSVQWDFSVPGWSYRGAEGVQQPVQAIVDGSFHVAHDETYVRNFHGKFEFFWCAR
jgi:hypothetical protein